MLEGDRAGSVHTKLKDRKFFFYFTIIIPLLGTETKLLKYCIHCLQRKGRFLKNTIPFYAFLRLSR